jgi:hypothetical protein
MTAQVSQPEMSVFTITARGGNVYAEAANGICCFRRSRRTRDI